MISDIKLLKKDFSSFERKLTGVPSPSYKFTSSLIDNLRFFKCELKFSQKDRKIELLKKKTRVLELRLLIKNLKAWVEESKGKKSHVHASMRILNAYLETNKMLDLSGLGLTEVPASIALLGKLKILDLTGNPISSPENFNHISKLNKNLETLYLGPDQISRLPQEARKLKGNITFSPKQMALWKLQKLQEAIKEKNLTEMKISALIVDFLKIEPLLPPGKSKAFKQILFKKNLYYWYQNSREEELAAKKAASLIIYDAFVNQREELLLFGMELESVPYCIGLLSSLKTLDLSNNRLVFLPDTFSGLSKMETLKLHNNKLAYLPSEILLLNRLKTITLFKNSFSEIPSPITTKKKLSIYS